MFHGVIKGHRRKVLKTDQYIALSLLEIDGLFVRRAPFDRPSIHRDPCSSSTSSERSDLLAHFRFPSAGNPNSRRRGSRWRRHYKCCTITRVRLANKNVEKN